MRATKIKSQLIISMVVFGLAILVITYSAFSTNLAVNQLSDQQDLILGIQEGSGQLNSISNQYFLQQQGFQIAQWQKEFATISNNVEGLRAANDEQRTFLIKIGVDLQKLSLAFENVVMYLSDAPRNQSIRILPEFQILWGNLSIQNEALSADSALLSQSMGNQADLLKTENSALIVALLFAFGAYFVTNYFIMYRKGLKSVAKLQAGTKIVGEGNLDYVIETEGKDELEGLSKTFNSMTRNLKNLTTTKKQLENEIEVRKKVEDQLENSKSMLERERNLLQVLMDEPKNMHLVYLDRDFNFLRVNAAYAQTCGYKPEEMIGKNHFALYPHAENEAIFTRVRNTGLSVSFHDKPFTFPDQPERGVTYWDWTLSPIKDCSGMVEGLVFALIETTERKKAEEMLNNALEDSRQRQNEVTALLTASKTVLHNRGFSSSARVIFDSCKELIGASSGYIALLSDDGKDNIVQFLDSGGLPCSVDPSFRMPIRGLRAETYNTGKVACENRFLESEWDGKLPKGHMDLKNVLFAPLKVDGKTVGIMGLANKPGGFTEKDAQLSLAFGDIASIALINSNMIEMLEENESKLRDYSENLERTVEEKTKQLKNSERLAAIGATAGMVGHDIRNPLQAIMSDVYLLKSALKGMPENPTKEEVKDSLDGIEENVDYVNKIVQDLQDYARPVKPVTREIDLEELCENVIFKTGLPKKIEASTLVDKKARRIVTDPELLRRVLTNLRNNAIQAMPNGGKLELHVFKDTYEIVMKVKDTGVGIPEDVKPNLFTPLFTTKSKGQGFGLPVVKRLTEALGGRVSFESKVGMGTTFIVRLPAKATLEP